MEFFQKFYFEFPRILYIRGSCSTIFFWKILSKGLSGIKHVKMSYIRGDTGGGRGYPYHIGGYYRLNKPFPPTFRYPKYIRVNTTSSPVTDMSITPMEFNNIFLTRLIVRRL